MSVNPQDQEQHQLITESWLQMVRWVYRFSITLVVIVISTLILTIFDAPLSKSSENKGEVPMWAGETHAKDEVVDGVHLQTGLIYAPGFEAVRANCINCHSAKLITQNRASREGWKEMIQWMQATQGLADLGEMESTIVNYLGEHYAPREAARRPLLDMDNIEWYMLEPRQ